ncbi:MAG: hypothetical protein KatS3mg110_1873 [Pirellulaceae bacterium]|nr:MAG: hypothetical protein KatS3mg110_1873 [Pirellulaceae bacterium]
MAIHRTCDGMRRRDFLKVGAIGGMGFTLATYLRMAKAGQVKPARAKSAIFIHLAGGPSHLDTFDMKPQAPDEYRGKFRPIDTNVPGIQISEHLPKLAKCVDKYVILRGVTHTLAAHQLGSQYVNTGTRPIASLEYPGYGAVVTKETWQPSDLPPFVAIPSNNYQTPGFLGVKYAPLNTGATPRAGQPFSVRGISLGNGLTVAEVERRHQLLRDLDVAFRGFESEDQLLEGLDEFSRQAYAIITSPRSRDAFDISKESPAFAKMFGETPFGVSCLLATRLIESGVRFVTLSYGGWDTHQDNFTRLKDRVLPPFDEGLAALFEGLHQKGLLESTVVFVTGEFGRTPKINNRSAEGGRDHYPRCMFMLLAGGGIRGGQVLGESDDKATAPRHEGFKPDDVAASFYHALGIDHTKEYHTDTGRPITIVRDGRVIRELFA